MATLAIKGGTRVRTKPFSSWPVFGKEEEEAILEVVRSGAWGRVSGGKKNEEFEERFARYQGVRYAVTCVNGTAALEIALRAMGVGPGDEVIAPPYTFIATASAAVLVGATPRFVDIDPDTYNIDPEKIEEAITPKTKAIVVVHIGGCPANMDRILEIAKKHNLMVLEDAAQAVGAEWRGRKVGAIGTMGAFSLQASKNLNAGEGGVVTTDDKELGDMAWSLMNVGRVKTGGWYDHPVLGWNYRMTEFQAAIALAQMNRLEEQMRTREENARYLSEELRKIGGVDPLVPDEGVTRHAYHLYIFRYRSEEFEGLSREKFLRALSAEGIPVSSGYVPLYRFPALIDSRKEAGYEKLHLPVTERACNEEGVWIFQSVLLGTKEDMDDIIEAISKIKAHVDEAR